MYCAPRPLRLAGARLGILVDSSDIIGVSWFWLILIRKKQWIHLDDFAGLRCSFCCLPAASAHWSPKRPEFQIVTDFSQSNKCRSPRLPHLAYLIRYCLPSEKSCFIMFNHFLIKWHWCWVVVSCDALWCSVRCCEVVEGGERTWFQFGLDSSKQLIGAGLEEVKFSTVLLMFNMLNLFRSDFVV